MTMKNRTHRSRDTVKLVCQALDSKKAGDLRVLDVSEISTITDFIVIATGTSEPHLRALRIELEKTLDQAGVRIIGMDTEQGSGWMVVDAFDVMVHVFTAQTREAYGLERLWSDAVDMSVARILAGELEPLPVSKPAKVAKKPAAKKASSAKTGVKKASSRGAAAKKGTKTKAKKGKAPARATKRVRK
jgi:ribosome-associated protein